MGRHSTCGTRTLYRPRAVPVSGGRRMSRRAHDPLAPLVISERNLSHAWGRALLHVVDCLGADIKPLMLSIRHFRNDGLPEEDGDIRAAVDAFLETKGGWSVEIVAFTIFPQRYWQVNHGDRRAFYQMCFDALPHLKAKNPTLNGKGLYFERLMKFGRGSKDENQLEYMLSE